MYINLYSMALGSGAAEATLTRSKVSLVSYKLNAERVRADFKSIKAGSLDLLHQGSVDEADISAIHTGSIDRSVKTSYTAEVFFHQRQLTAASEDGTYTIMDVGFTAEELQQTRLVLRTAAESINAGVGRSATLDYSDYAQMGIAYSAVKAYAEKSLSAEQGAAVVSAMGQYNEALINMERELFAGGGYASANYEGVSEYYGMGRVLTEADAKVFNDLIDEMNRLSGGSRGHMSAGDVTTVQSATNRELIGALTDLFSELSIGDSFRVDSAMERYRSLMSPVYTAMGFRADDGSLSRILEKDVSTFTGQIKSIMTAAAYRSVDVSL